MKVLRANIPPPSPDRADTLFRNASAFWNAFCGIANSLGATGDVSLIGPLWVNVSFSAELYLKFLIARTSGQAVKIHDLHKLFNLLPSSNRDAINKEYESALSDSEFYRFISSAWQRQDFKLVTVLAKAAKTFETWRYPGEGVDLNAPGSLQHVVKALQVHIHNTFPESSATLQTPLAECHLTLYGGVNE